MAITVDQTSIGTPVALGTSLGTISITTNVTVAANALIVLYVAFDSPATGIASASGGGLTWSVDKVAANGSSGDVAGIVSAYAAGGLASGTTITVTLSGGNSSSRMLAGTSFLGTASSSYIDGTPISATQATAAWSTGNYTVAAGSVIVACAETDTATTDTITGPSVETVDFQEGTGGNTTTGAYRIEASGGSVPVAGTWASGTQGVEVAVAYLETGGGPPFSPPVVEGTAESSTNTAGTSHTVTLPASIQASDLVLIIMDIGSTSATMNALTDWTEILDESAANGLKIWWYTGAGVPGNPTFTSSASTRDATISYRISNADKTITPQIGTTGTGTSATPDPPSVTPTGGVSKDYLFIAFYGAAGEEADDDTWSDTPPTNYTPSPPRQKSCGTVGTNLGGLIAAAERQFTTGSAENPGTFAKDVSAAWRSQTIIIHPTVAAAAASLLWQPPTTSTLYIR